MEEENAPCGKLQRNGDHTILMDEPARNHLEDLAERTAYFTTNLVITDIKVRQLASPRSDSCVWGKCNE